MLIYHELNISTLLFDFSFEIVSSKMQVRKNLAGFRYYVIIKVRNTQLFFKKFFNGRCKFDGFSGSCLSANDLAILIN